MQASYFCHSGPKNSTSWGPAVFDSLSQPNLDLFHQTLSVLADFFLLENWLMVASVVLIWKTRSSYFLTPKKTSLGPAVLESLSQPIFEMFHQTYLFWRNFFLLENWLMVASVVLIWKTRSSYFCHCWHWQICAYNWWFLHLLLFNSKQKWSHFLSCKLSLHHHWGMETSRGQWILMDTFFQTGQILVDIF